MSRKIPTTRLQAAASRRLAGFRSPDLLASALSQSTARRLIESLDIPVFPDVEPDPPIDRVAEGLLLAEAAGMSTHNILKEYKDGAVIRGIPFSITDEQADALFRLPCHYCHHKEPHFFNGIDRVDNSRGYIAGNVVPCCSWCNRAKGRRPVDVFLRWLRALQGAADRDIEPKFKRTYEDHKLSGEE